MCRTRLAAAVVAVAAALLSAGPAAAAPLERVLVFSETAGFRHDSIPAGVAAIQELGAANGFAVDATEDSTAFTDANLAQYDAVIFLNTTGDVLTDEQQGAFERYIQAGNGYVGIHSAADTEYGWDWYGDLVGGFFASHPPGTPTASIDVEDATHPSTATVPTRWTRTDEWYNYKPPAAGPAAGGDYSPRYDVHVLARVDESTYDEQDGSAEADDHPIVWCSNFDGGHAWYTGFGHTAATYSEPDFREHLLGGLRSVTDFEGAGCGPQRVPSPSAADFEKVTLDDDTSNPFELDIAPDGRVFYIERDGRVMLWKPTTETTVQIGSVPVTQSQENGLLGIQLAPDFMTSGHIYLAYSALPDSSNQNRVSRFTVVGDQIQPGSEQFIYTWQHQREECCHTAGSLAFGLDGSLYISTGDNTNPFESSGFTPIDERPGREAWDAQRTSANSNDPNGKILRIVPLAGATGTPGIGTTYAIPPGNMFDEAQDTQNQTLPEIYAMGFRNPFRITVDPKTGWLLLGDYGPDAGATVANRGPQGSVEFNVVDQPGFYGWPYCVRDNVPYNDYDFATGVSGPKFNCANPVNNSPNNTGLTNLPPAQPATTWHGYTERDPRFPYLGTGGAPTGGPRYDFDPANTSTTKFPEYYDGKWFIGEWNNGWIKTATLNDDGSGRGVGPFDLETGYLRPMDIEFGPDGSLYVIEWGSGFGGNNVDSGIYRIDYVGEGRRPVAHATATPDSGPAPLTVQFSSAGSNDPDGTALTYAWDFDGDETVDSTEPNPTFEYTTPGNYTATLRVTDESGATGVDNVPITVGNSRPQVTIELPENGQVAAFGDVIPYEITVTDAEDGSTPDGGINCADVTLNISLGHDEHAHELDEKTGCEGTFETLSATGHGDEANVFPVIEAVYTDRGSGQAGPLTGRDEVILQPDPKQAEFFTSTGRVPGAPPGGDPGVQTETTSDPEGGGLNIGFIEDGDYVSYEPFNLEGIRGLSFRVASAGAGGTIQLRLDAPDGPLVAETGFIAPTGGWQVWTDEELALPTPPEGTHELFLVFRGGSGGLMNLNFVEFVGKGAAISEAPVVSAAADPTTGTAPLTVNFDGEATDPDGQPGDTLTYHWDFGVSGTTTDTSNELDPTFTYERAGTYTARFTATDPTGQKSSDSVQVRVTPSDQCPTGPVRSDEFDGNSLDTNRWTVERSNDNFEVANGELRLPIDNGSMYGAGTTARNIIVQPTPEGAWEVTAKLRTEPLTENYHQAGLRVWSGDDNWASVHMIHAGGQRDIEFIYESNGQPRNEAADKLGGIPADSPTTYWVRIVSDGQQLTAFYSFDGDTFLPVGRPGSLSTFANPQIGPVALSDAAPSTPNAFFDWIRFEPDGTGGGGGDFVDEFNGTALASPPWEVVRQDQNLTVSGGALRIPAAQGDIYGGGGNAKNLVLRDAPDGAWEAITKLSFEGTAQYHQAGLLVYGDDDNFTKFGRIAHTEAGDEKFEFIYENAGSPRNEAPDSTANLPADFPDDFFLRITSDGTNITGAYSTDGATWTPVGRPAPLPANARIGVFAFNNQAATAPEAAFDSFRLTGPGGPPAGPSRDDQFDGSSLDTTRWNAIVRDNPSAYSVSSGELTITTEPGDIYTGDTTPPPNNFILQSADHAGADWVIETKLSGTINGGYGQGGLMAYGDGDNYVKLDAISDAGNTRINRIELRSEVGGAITDPQPNADVPVGTTDIWLRLTKTGTSYAGSYSFDGQTWTAMSGAVTNAVASPRFGVYAFGPQPEGQGDTVSFDYFTLDGPDTACPCALAGDAFDGAGLDKTRWNEIVREDDTKYVVDGGALRVTTVAGDIYTNGDPAPTRNFFLQSPDHAGDEDYVLETKIDVSELDGGYSQGGILVYTDDDNYVKFDPLSDAGQTRVNRIELRSEVAGVIQNPQPNADVPMGTSTVWLRLTKTGTTYMGEYSFDGTTWTALPNTVEHPQTGARFGLYTLGVQLADRMVAFDYFSVDGQTGEGCPPPPPTNRPPVIESASASPTSGFAPLQVDFAVTATDADGDDLSYSWDFDGDGTEDSTAEDPSHTYTQAGVYDAEVTVSDGEAERTRTVTVTVLAPDDPAARFRVLVFSKTTGFRHDSIDEGIAAVRALGRENEFQVDATEDSTVFRDSVLAHYDTVVFLNTTGDPLNNIQQAAFQRYIRAGGGYTGVHSAADTEYDWNWYGHLVGGYFLSHPPGTPTAAIDVEDLTNRSTEHLPARWERTDEWYNYRSPDFADPDVPDGDYSPREGGVHVLASVDESTYDEQDGNATDDDHPIAWCQPYDGGRSWYTGGGHTAASFSEPDFREHLLGGIEITAGAASSPECTNQGPTVQAAADPQTGDAPLTVSFTSAGSDPEGQQLVYSWDFGDGGSAFGQAATHTYQQPGTYMAKVTVTDPDGATGTAEVEIIVTDPPNQAPSVQAAADPGSGDAPLDVRFSAQGTDPDGDALVYEWDFGDGGRAFGAQATHTYMSAGEYDATVTVTDPDGATGTATVHVTVSGNHAPSVTMTANPQSGTAPLRVRFEAQGSDPDGGSLRYRWDFGDGSSPETDRRETHTYRNPGTYTARVTVTDREGASSSAEMEITVTAQAVNQAPSVTMTATPQTGAAPLLVGFVAEGNDPEGGQLSYRWSFGDDSDSESGREVTHRYRRRGTYTARVTVTDAVGERESAELRIVVTRSGGS